MERLCKEDVDFLLHLAFVIGVRRKSFASFVEKGDRYEFCKQMVRYSQRVIHGLLEVSC